MKKFDTEIFEEKKDVDFNPLDEPVNEKKYSQPNVNTTGIDMSKPIEEPKFTPPPFQKKAIPTQEQQQPKREPINPEMKNMPKKETEMAASQAAKMIMQGYEWMHELANKSLKISEKKLMKLQSEGEINLNAMIDYDNGVKISAGQFIQEYNSQVGEVLTVSNEFKEETMPVLERVLSKRGIGLTDEQYLMYLFGKDIAAKGLIFFSMKQQTNYMLENIKQASLAVSAPPPSPSPMTDNMPPNDPTPKSKTTNTNESPYSNIQTIDTDDEEDEYILRSRQKHKKEDLVIVSDKPKRGRPKK